MKTHQLTPAYFQKNRRALGQLLNDGSLVVLAAGLPPLRTSDAHYRFLANRNFFYLSGIEQEGSLLILFKEYGVLRTTLFIPAADALHERWNGKRLTRSEAIEKSGLTEVQYTEGFDGQLEDLITSRVAKLWLDDSAENKQAQSLRRKMEELHPALSITDVAPLLTQLRMIKQDEELELIRQAARLTGEGIMAMLAACQAGVKEYQLASEFMYTLGQAGCLEPAFESIVATGENALCLHYQNPMDTLKPGELVQVDVGAVVGGLCADISRALPVGGKFSPKQRSVYDLVRACQETAFATIKPGIRIALINDACQETARAGLLNLGILSQEQPVKEYFWHGVSHHLGLDVHDVANKEAVLKAGMVLTVEPGIYIPEWGFGMRLEDDVVVTKDGCHLLSAGIPREADEIEALMAR